MEKAMAPHSSTLAWKIPWTEEPGRLQSMGSLRVGTTERLHFHFSLSCIGEGNGNPLQYSCPENSLDRQPWWAIVHGVARSWTGLNNWAQTHTHTHTCRNWVNGSRIHSLCSFHVQSNSSYSRGIRIWSCLGSWCLDNSWRHYQLNKISDLRDKVKYFKTIVDFKTWIWKLVICILLLF